MKYRGLLDRKLAEFQKEVPEYSLAETIFAISRYIKGGRFSDLDLWEITDEQMYEVIDQVIKNEKED